jgi:hypothetical protein
VDVDDGRVDVDVEVVDDDGARWTVLCDASGLELEPSWLEPPHPLTVRIRTAPDTTPSLQRPCHRIRFPSAESARL